MDRLKERLTTAERAFASLAELVGISSPTKVERDAALQRFEYTFEACWKAAQRHLFVIEGIDSGSPKDVLRRSLQVGLLSEEETLHGLEMVDDRNLTVHTYNEGLAELIYLRLPRHSAVLRQWLTAMARHLENPDAGPPSRV